MDRELIPAWAFPSVRAFAKFADTGTSPGADFPPPAPSLVAGRSSPKTIIETPVSSLTVMFFLAGGVSILLGIQSELIMQDILRFACDDVVRALYVPGAEARAS
jgi:hypothetical protein